MKCRMGDLRNKEVINIGDGSRIGFICDIEVDTKTGMLTQIIVYGRLKFFGLLGREEDFIIPWRDIVLIGDDAVLVKYEQTSVSKKSFLSSLFG
jgi:sporulation protein, YlmC/YmxH family